MDWQALWLTLKLATATTAILLVLGLPLAWWLATSRSLARYPIDVLIALPLVLPPTVLGFYMLLATGPKSWFGQWIERIFGTQLPFTFAGILLASVICNLPFAIRPFAAGFGAIDRRLLEAGWCLGASRTRTFFSVALPLSWPAILAGVVLTFAHTVGEFGVVLMMGGNIPGITRTLALAIYDNVQAMNYEAAADTAFWLVIFSCAVLAVTSVIGYRRPGVA